MSPDRTRGPVKDGRWPKVIGPARRAGLAVAMLCALFATPAASAGSTWLKGIEIGEVTITHRRGGSVDLRGFEIDLARHEVNVSRIVGKLFEGSIATDAIRLGGDRNRNPVLRIDGLDLASILEFLEIDGLDGEGTLDGELPLSLSRSRPVGRSPATSIRVVPDACAMRRMVCLSPTRPAWRCCCRHSRTFTSTG
ncbi:MAG: YdbH domain-containing protein [Geminicoccaceae bacterium]